MSTDQVQKNTDILARGHGGEPLRRTVCGIEDSGAVRITESRTGRTALFPQIDVFRFDPRLEGELMDAYQRRDQARLAELWDSGERFAPETG